MPSDTDLQRILPEGRRDDDGPVFAEPWQAQAFAMVVKLHEQGAFTWPEWAEYLSAEIRTAGSTATGEDYYDHWLTALERIVEDKQLMSRAERTERKDAWDRAARATPHGQPIVLGAETTTGS